jgi:hypothetical protein
MEKNEKTEMEEKLHKSLFCFKVGLKMKSFGDMMQDGLKHST